MSSGLSVAVAVDNLTAARRRSAAALRAKRRIEIELVREVIAHAWPVLRHEAVRMPDRLRDGEYEPMPRGCLIVDETVSAEVWNGETVVGLQLWLTDGGFVVVDRQTYYARVWSRGERDPSYDYLTTARAVGLREAVRRWDGERLARGILRAVEEVARSRAMVAAETAAACARMTAALAALRK